jgi:hypothetical protein
MLKHITPEQATEMRRTVHLRSDSYIDFAASVARSTGDTLAYDIYFEEMERRIDLEGMMTRRYAADILAIVAPLDAIPTWDQVNPNA